MKTKSFWIVGALLLGVAFVGLSMAHGPGGNNRGYDGRGGHGYGMMGGGHMMGGMGMMRPNQGNMMENNGYLNRGWDQNRSNQTNRENFRDAGPNRSGPDAPADSNNYRNRSWLNPFNWFRNHHMW